MSGLLQNLQKMPPWVWAVAAVGVVATIASVAAVRRPVDEEYAISSFEPEPEREQTEEPVSSVTYDQNLLEQIAVGQDQMYRLLGGIQPVSYENDGQYHGQLARTVADEVFAGDTPTEVKHIWQAPVTEVFGGHGGGMVTAENSAQIDEFYTGGSKNVGGSYRIEAEGWSPSASGVGSEGYSRSQVSVVTGKSGSVESQLAGLSASQKLAALKKSKLVN